MLRFDDVLVTPFTELLHMGGPSLHRGGPHWPEFDQQIDARHCRTGVPIDDPPDFAPEEATLEGRFAWGGAVLHHFGHQVADFGMRLGPTVRDWPDAVFLYQAHEISRIRSIDRAPEVFKGMLAWLGIPLERVRLLDRPVRVEELVVAPQSEQLKGPGPSAAHLDWLDELMEKRLGQVVRNGVVYVSRAGMPTRFAAESYLEEALSRSGVRVVRPETLPLPEQLRIYASARQLIFADGSAMNGTQLLGRALGEVTVLQRRTDVIAARTALEPRAKSLRYVDVVRGLIHGLHRFAGPEPWVGITALDGEALVDEFESLGVPVKLHWSSEVFSARRDADVRQWLAERRDSGIDAKVPGSAECIEQTLRAAGLGHLMHSP